MTEPKLRRAAVPDAEEIAAIHIQSWRETYAGMMPAGTLAGLDPAEWAERWRGRLGEGGASAVFLALEESGAPAGFGCCRRQSSEKLAPLGFDGEIASLYLLKRAQGRGLGRRLLVEMADHLRRNGCKSAAVWVFRDAPHARRFYEANGATPTGVEGVWNIYGMSLPDLALGWRDIGPLAALRRI
jgi:GNAT superfamily N-acetyltransferase